ncbi:Ribosomal protein S6 kinase alpha-5 [Eumeta japonica]|uniref:Ribosomal protein S6 kinase alpha-5 n=1 Tax=Eumeta variegata TaxID=151549 RepID=A0A4C1SCX0_EUMVA|nr:Ribosomal protein S6 kinase alpha-5 [Eumeta japonica]
MKIQRRVYPPPTFRGMRRAARARDLAATFKVPCPVWEVRARATLDFDSSRVRENRAPGPRRDLFHYCSLYVAFNEIHRYDALVHVYDILYIFMTRRHSCPRQPRARPSTGGRWGADVRTADGRLPFTVEGERNTHQEITKRILRCNYPVPPDVGPDIADFIAKLLVKDPRKRLGGGDGDAEELKRHTFFKVTPGLGRGGAPRCPRRSCRRSRTRPTPATSPTSSPACRPPTRPGAQTPRQTVPSTSKANELAHYQNEVNTTARGHHNPKERAMLYRPFAEWDIRWRVGVLVRGAEHRILRERDLRRDMAKATGRTNDNLKGWNAKIISVQKKDIKQEVDLLRACQGCPYIVTLHEVFQDSAFTYIVTELVSGGELASQLSRPLPERVALRLCAQLAHAVYMHARGLVHRDIKPEVKVVDFGFAAETRRRRATSNDDPCFRCFYKYCYVLLSDSESDVILGFDLDPTLRSDASLPYAAPEVLDRVRSSSAQGYDASCDLWSLGVIFYCCMISRKPPFQPRPRKPITAFMDRIREGTFNIEGPIWNGVTDHSKDLVRGLLSVDPLRRLTAEEVIAHLSDTGFKLADMTKADLYKRRNKNKTHKSINTDTSSLSNSSSSEPNKTPNDESKDALLETINNLKNRMNKQTSIENDLELIKPTQKILASGAKTTGAAKKTRADKTNPSKESIENDKSARRLTRKRRFEETLAKPVLREKGKTGRTSITKPKPSVKPRVEQINRKMKYWNPRTEFQGHQATATRNESKLCESNQSRSSNARSRQKSSNQKGYKSKAKPVRQSRNRRR